MDFAAFLRESYWPHRLATTPSQYLRDDYLPLVFHSLLYAAWQIPPSLYRESGYDHREALFGLSPYGGGSIREFAYYADDPMCGNDGDVDYASKGYPEREVVNGTMMPWEPPFILVVDRGGCTFVRKVRYAFDPEGVESGEGRVCVPIERIVVCPNSTCNSKLLSNDYLFLTQNIVDGPGT